MRTNVCSLHTTGYAVGLRSAFDGVDPGIHNTSSCRAQKYAVNEHVTVILGLFCRSYFYFWPWQYSELRNEDSSVFSRSFTSWLLSP